uniref:Uncharacterized protein n=1 Tax=Arion vulgaris TaxID=1028688 RepID=A0A0B7B0X3_9EUPU
MPDKLIPKQLTYDELEGGRCSVSGHKNRFIDTLKVSLECFDKDTTYWESLAQDCQMWRYNNTRGTSIAENRCAVEV